MRTIADQKVVDVDRTLGQVKETIKEFLNEKGASSAPIAGNGLDVPDIAVRITGGVSKKDVFRYNANTRNVWGIEIYVYGQGETCRLEMSALGTDGVSRVQDGLYHLRVSIGRRQDLIKMLS